ncbi:MAG: DEAD/DEAH box helicase [Gemmatales bacterium]|nr:DEAD/DEAH box helicase [Gemmatales bacterium]MDW7995083.1 DEAD/DEAH box helicase [Gemmatales bacterium]
MSETGLHQDVWRLFLPVVATWFQRHLGEPSPIQKQGWPIIATGQHTLLIAPTGSGKTLAAFLVALDRLWRTASDADTVRVLYISPLRALNYDISRNLEVPLAGVQQLAHEWGLTLPKLRLAVRTGDTPTRERWRLRRKPPHILITTPESLHLLLTSRAREMLRQVEVCILDEWHALYANKRGVFTCLLLERLAALNPREFQRIGLSATLRPAEVAAQMLGGVGRAVTVLDLGQSRPLDVAVLAPAVDMARGPETSVWSALESATLQLIAQHTSTLVFTNNRRAAEHLSARLRESWDWSSADWWETSTEPPIRAHHGSLSLPVRRQTEQALKAGALRAVVATASLELGLDLGSVHLVCQIESPGSVYRAWQRLGRSGHTVGAVCKGRFLAKTASDLLELAALVRAMRQGILETLQPPQSCLDVLAQQIVAMVAMDVWPVAELERVVRRAWPYRDLPSSAWQNVLAMLSGRGHGFDKKLARPRISWDQATGQLYPLPGSQHLALVNGGTIPDTGQYKVILADNRAVLGTLDEEFVYERRLGDVFVLGTGVWRIVDIGPEEVVVSHAATDEPVIMPFWRGERLGRSWELGQAVAQLLRELAERLHDPDTLDWLQRECSLEERAARHLLDYVQRQIQQTGTVPSDRVLVVEAFPDEMGDWYLAILAPFGYRWNLTLRLAVEAWWKEHFGFLPPAVHHDDGILVRLMDVGTPPLDIWEHLDPARLESDILHALTDSAFFAIRFRHNAMRALLLPRLHPHRRTPLWLQRLKARNWLQLVRDYPDFPIVVETYRECLQEHLDIPRLRQVLEAIARGNFTVHRAVRQSPSPFAAQLRFHFTGAFMYDYDRVVVPQSRPQVSLEGLRELIGPVAKESIEPTVLEATQNQATSPIRSEHELAEWLRQRGDTLPQEIPPGQEERLRQLVQLGRIIWWQMPGPVQQPGRWIAAENLPLFRTAFAFESEARNNSAQVENRVSESADELARREILRRHILHQAHVSLTDLSARYPLSREWLERTLDGWVRQGWLCRLTDAYGNTRYVRSELVEQARQHQRQQRRRAHREVPLRQYARFLLHWHGLVPQPGQIGTDALRRALSRLQALWLPASVWESLLLHPRVPEYQSPWLDMLIQNGEWLWLLRSEPRTSAELRNQPSRLAACELAFLPRSDAEFASCLRPPEGLSKSPLAEQLYEALTRQGASFVVDLARITGWAPSRIRQALRELALGSLVSNDHFDVVRHWEAWNAWQDGQHKSGWRRRLLIGQTGEGRWFALPQQQPRAEAVVLWWVHVLFERYGVVCRELASYESCPLPWSVLRAALEQLEWAGEALRGYFIEGWSGEQYALPEAIHLLYQASIPPQSVIPVSAIDPAALVGLDAETDKHIFGVGVRTSRRVSHAIIWLGDEPAWLVENFGQQLTALTQRDMVEAHAALTALSHLARWWRPWLRGRLQVLTCNQQPVTDSPIAQTLHQLGFVRDYEGLTLYLGSD